MKQWFYNSIVAQSAKIQILRGTASRNGGWGDECCTWEDTMNKPASLFPRPSDVAPVAGAEDWKEMYPYYMVPQPELKEQDEGKFWFCNSQHWPVPLRPFDSMQLEYSGKTLGQYNTRQWMIPPANGVEGRIINGYVYLAMVPVPPEQIEARVPEFMQRAGYYFQNWDRLVEAWEVKVRALIAEMEEITFDPLPESIPMEWVVEGKGLDNTTDIMENWDKLLNCFHRVWQYHFEFLNLGYAAYVDFFAFIKSQFPTIPDQAVAKMVQGVDSLLFKPDDELKALAKLALKLDVAGQLGTGDADAALAAVAAAPNGAEWVTAWEAVQDPWFNMSTGSGLLSSDKRWIDHLDIPLGYIRDYIVRLQAGETIDRPVEELRAERDRITAEYRDLFDEEGQAAFDEKIGLCHVVFPYVEDHNFFIEHWSMGVFWRKVREFSRLLETAGFYGDEEGLFYMTRVEVREALFDMVSSYSSGTEPVGKAIWPAKIEKRKAMLEAMAIERPIPALNNPPEHIEEPFTIMLWGINDETIAKWAAASEQGDDKLSGMAASPGVVEGTARVLQSPDQLGELEKGDILVASVTAPSWAPVFGKIGAAVTDIGGIMSHAAIVCREYGLPAVTGTGFATAKIKTGMKLRVDGNTGEVTVL
jgi:pyruvate,water dikinase